MKTYGNLYNKLCSYENLLLAFKKARKGKTKKLYVRRFEENLKENLLELQKRLLSKSYRPALLKKIIVRDPKTRKIYKSVFIDRIVHHAIVNILKLIFELIFIWDSYASRKGKGHHKAIKRFDYTEQKSKPLPLGSGQSQATDFLALSHKVLNKPILLSVGKTQILYDFKRKVSKNGRKLKGIKDNNYICGYVLKADIKHYFDEVNHKVLLEIIREKVKDEEVMWLIRQVLENYRGGKQGCGMPLGNYTSQFFANVYLNELDYFVKHFFRAKYYTR